MENINQQPNVYASIEEIIEEFKKYFSSDDAIKVAEKFIKVKGTMQLRIYIQERVQKWADKEYLFKRTDKNNSTQQATQPQPQLFNYSSSIQKEKLIQQATQTKDDDEWFKFIQSNSRSNEEWKKWINEINSTIWETENINNDTIIPATKC